MFTQKIKALRNKKGLTQAEMADKIEVARTTYAMYEQGKREPDFEILKRLATFFNVSTDYLLDITNKEESQDFAAHRSDDMLDDLPEEAIKEVENFKAFIRSKYASESKRGNS